MLSQSPLPQAQEQQSQANNPVLIQVDQKLNELAQTVETSNGQPSQRVTIVDIDMRLGEMAVFMLKWTIAAIPSLIILFILGFIALVGSSMLFSILFMGRFAD